VDRVEVTVVGVGLFPDEVVQDEKEFVTYVWTSVEVEGWHRRVDGFKREHLAALPAGAPASFRKTSEVIAATQEAVRPLAVVLGFFGGLEGIATLVLVGQAVVRLLRTDRSDLQVLRAIGAGPGVVSLAPVPGAAASIAVGVAAPSAWRSRCLRSHRSARCARWRPNQESHSTPRCCSWGRRPSPPSWERSASSPRCARPEPAGSRNSAGGRSWPPPSPLRSCRSSTPTKARALLDGDPAVAEWSGAYFSPSISTGWTCRSSAPPQAHR
jgi:hypothetical protein